MSADGTIHIHVPTSNGLASGAKSPSSTVAVPELPPQSDDDRNALTDIQKRQQVLRDLTMGCIVGNHTGAYISGPPGGGKTFTVLETIREWKTEYRYLQRVTAKPLYLEFERYPGANFVIDDCEQLFQQPAAQTLLRSVLGGERVNGRRERRVTFSVSRSNARVMESYFYGSVIFLANRPLNDTKPEIRGVISRIPCMTYAPTDREVRALMRHLARQGYQSEGGRISPPECVEIVEFIISLAATLRGHLDLRWFEHGCSHYLTHVAHGGGVDWRDMTKFHIMSTTSFFDHPPQVGTGKGRQRESAAAETTVALEIARTEGLTLEQRLRLWEERTGLSRPTYYRRLKVARELAAQ